MTRPPSWSFLAMLWMAAGCVRANFVPVGSPDAEGDADRSSCTNPTSPVFGCQVRDGGVCDPVCQSGGCAWCVEKCSLDNSGVAVCAAGGSKDIGEKCTIFDEGTSQQTDDCRSGAICLTPNVGGSPAYCFALCRNSVDCLGNVACAARPLGLGAVALVCDPEYTTCDTTLAIRCCDPLSADPASNGCGDGRFCYLVTADPGGRSRTTCEYATGGKAVGEACQSSGECMEKCVCVPSDLRGPGICQRVCSSSTPCTSGTCVPLGSEFGYCRV